ncbi:hypothetical protein B0T26DRAFT_756246 [Lasiosphaeria miniovina]|uniref:non-specific serine/threonine protein kinase n=1 Tax=Lasiosphaeria miniovina TaxID=1954250 RepID=A0AA40DKQ3_9PEZI|nr:uncharacterized protein B0T26DRAFT_756246 [Lasiosphaeria miniovina]KAK0706790.1 hypothetical protein B0T26DRAFT_756246 [Lasiosphaeria miniovina]
MGETVEAGSHLLPHYFETDVDDILDDVFNDIGGYIHSPVDRFMVKYFARFDSILQDTVTGIIARDRYPFSLSPRPSVQDILAWFSALSLEGVNGARGTWHACCHAPAAAAASEPEGSSGGGAHLLLTRSAAFDPNIEASWRDVEVIGQFCQDDNSSGGTYLDGLLALGGHARAVFAAQPTRLFLHGFYVFDRSGLYSSGALDLRRDSRLTPFLSAVLGYRLMRDGELGRSGIIRTDEVGSFITFELEPEPGHAAALGEKLYLEDQPIALSRTLVGQGTACYRGRRPTSSRWHCVVKFTWRWARTRPEEELLRLAGEKGVRGLVSLDYDKRYTSTADLRSGLRWGPHRRLVSQQQQQQQQQHQADNLIPRGTAAAAAGAGAGILDVTEATSRFLQNRILTCLVVSPAGRPLWTFQTALELLRVLCDAVSAHWSLLQRAGILHRDVSPQNIVIADGDSGSVGILIDLDVALDVASGGPASPPGEVVGTRMFMAVELLLLGKEGGRHTHRHDLESFLYVLLWAAIANGSDSLLGGSRLRLWGIEKTWDDSAAHKARDMSADSFSVVLAEIPPRLAAVRPLAKNLRRVLFPEVVGTGTGTGTGTDDVDAVYDAVLGAFEEAVALEAGSGRGL